MRPITTQEFVNCYGLFIADIVKVSTVYSNVWSWFTSTFPELSLMYKLNKPAFDTVTSTIRVPARPTFKPGYGGLREIAYDKNMRVMNTTVVADLTWALSRAEVDPTIAKSIVSSYQRIAAKLYTGGR